MPLPTIYSTGTVSVANGGTTVTGVGTAWLGTIYAGDLFTDPVQGIFARVTADAVSNTSLSINAWPGTSLSGDDYEILITPDTVRMQERTRMVLNLLTSVTNTGIGIDAFGLFADRTDHDAEVAGFAYLSTDGDGGSVTTPVVFLKNTATSADWSGAIGITGPEGDVGPAGVAGVWRGAYSGATAYVQYDIVQDAGSSWIAKGATTGNAPPTIPTTSNTYWELLVQRGAAGAGTGDVVGPGSSVDGQVALFDGTTGKLIKDSGVVLGTAAASDVGDFATSTQGGKADTALQPAAIANMLETADIGVTVQAYDSATTKNAATQTLTNKRVTPRVTSIASNATPTVNTDTTDIVDITALAVAITSMSSNLTGTPTIGQVLVYQIKDNGTARAITWGASFTAKGTALPTTTVISKYLTVVFMWNGANWGCVGSKQEA